MKTLLGTYDLKNRLTGRYEPASLFEGIDELIEKKCEICFT